MLKKILLPLDGSEFAEKALSYAKSLAETFEAELLVVRVAHPVPIMADYATVAYETYVAAEQQATETYLQEINLYFQGSPFSVRTLALQYMDAASGIIDLACEEKVDLIVMSTHGRSGFSRWIHGSVATKVLQASLCPVLLVRANT